ncbi:MAG TPA: hypothetical protein VK483_16380 [Chitinophagaceae bacterium]|nr:hypothetical protein [Chitinophagaceae bacterium]
MLTPTIAFSLITCADIKAAGLIANIIQRVKLHNRILLVKTSKGNYAKLYVQSGDDLRISDLVVYNPQGCIIKTATNLVIHGSFYCDVDNAVETGNNANADFKWNAIAPGDSTLDPKNGAGFSRLPDIDDVTFSDLSTAVYSDHRIPREWLKRQLIYCKTSQGRFAKLAIEWGNDLMVRQLNVFNANGTQHLAKANVTINQTWLLDLDTGVVGATGDIWWEAETADISTHYLTASNGAKLSFDSFYQYEKYLPLLKHTGIRLAMVISGASDRNYNNWTQEEKLQLREFIYLLETNKALPLVGPPALSSDTFMSPCDALKIYMAHVAQCFWVDANNKVTWKLTGATFNHFTHLFDMRKLYKFTAGSGHSFDFFVMGAVTDWSPAICYKFLTDNAMIKADIWSTIKAVAEWVRANLFHISGFANDLDGGPFATQQDQWQYIFGYRGLPPMDKMITPLPGKKHVTHGCWGTDGFFAAVLRTVNIPVKHGRSNFSGDSHSRAEFFTDAKNLKHGDDPYNGWVRLGINNVPIHRVFLTNAEITSLIDAPAALPGKTVPETASFYHHKFSTDLGIEFKTSYLLKLRCQDKASGINNGAGSKVWENLKEFYTNAQIATIVADCDVAIAAIGGGCATVNAS